jgi:hypothetical protein
VRAAVTLYTAALAAVPSEQDDVIGYVAAVNGRVVSGDVYAASALFRKLWPKLLNGIAVEACIESEPGREVYPVEMFAVRSFLAEAESVPPHDEEVTKGTCVLVRRSDRALLVESCDRHRSNLVLHRSFLVR